MRKSLAIAIPSVAFATLALSLLVASPHAAQLAKPAKTVQKWEYTSGRDNGMNKMGEDGWEAYAVTPGGGFPQVWYKRPKIEPGD